MIKSQKHILFFDFLQKYFPFNDNILNVVKKKFVKEDKSIVNSSHPPLETILIDCKGISVKASPFKKPLDDCPAENRMIIEQNNCQPIPSYYWATAIVLKKSDLLLLQKKNL